MDVNDTANNLQPWIVRYLNRSEIYNSKASSALQKRRTCFASPRRADRLPEHGRVIGGRRSCKVLEQPTPRLESGLCIHGEEVEDQSA